MEPDPFRGWGLHFEIHKLYCKMYCNAWIPIQIYFFFKVRIRIGYKLQAKTSLKPEVTALKFKRKKLDRNESLPKGFGTDHLKKRISPDWGSGLVEWNRENGLVKRERERVEELCRSSATPRRLSASPGEDWHKECRDDIGRSQKMLTENLMFE